MSHNLMHALLQGVIDLLMQKKQAIADRDLSALERVDASLTGMLAQLHKVDAQQLTACASACRTIQQLTLDIRGLLRSEYQRVSSMLALFETSGTYWQNGQTVALPYASRERQA